MAFFGLMTIYNIKKTRVLPIAISRDRRTGTQLTRMLLLQVDSYIILNVPSSITDLMFVILNDLKVKRLAFFLHLCSLFFSLMLLM
jgi:hypothetical protein